MKRKTVARYLLIPILGLLFSCASSDKTISIETGVSLLSSALSYVDSASMTWTQPACGVTLNTYLKTVTSIATTEQSIQRSFTYRNPTVQIAAIDPQNPYFDDDYSLDYLMVNDSTRTEKVVTYESASGKIYVTENGVRREKDDSDTYMSNFYAFPRYLQSANENLLRPSYDYLMKVSKGQDNTLSSYNLRSGGGGSLTFYLKGEQIDFDLLLEESLVVPKQSVTSLSAVVSGNLLSSFTATFFSQDHDADNKVIETYEGQVSMTFSYRA